MNRKSKMIATISTLCLALVMLTFSVLAATTVSFTIGGTVSYVVDDVLCRINTQLYYSTNNTLLKYADAYNAGYDISQAETLPQDIKEAPDEYFTGKEIKTYNKQTGEVIYLTEQDLTFDDVLIPMGRYDSTSQVVKSYKYYLVIEVENYGESNISVIVTDNTTTENASKLINVQRDITNNGVSIAKDETKKVVLAFSLLDITQNIESTPFDYSVLIEKAKDPSIVTADSLQSGTLTQVSSVIKDTVTLEGVSYVPEMDDEGSDYAKINLTLENIPDGIQTMNISATNTFVVLGFYEHFDGGAVEAYQIWETKWQQGSEDIVLPSDSGTFKLTKIDENNRLEICLILAIMKGVDSSDITLSYISSSGTRVTIDTLDGETLTQVSETLTDTVTFEGVGYVPEVDDEGSDYAKINLTLENIPDGIQTMNISATNSWVVLGFYEHFDGGAVEAYQIWETKWKQSSEDIVIPSDSGTFKLTKKDENNRLEICLILAIMKGVDSSDITLNYSADTSGNVKKILYKFEDGAFVATPNGEYFDANEDVVIEASDFELYKVHTDGRTYNVSRIDFNNVSSSTLKSISLPNTITSMSNYCFANITSLTYVDLGGIESIGRNAFYSSIESNLTTVILRNVETIESYAFYNCTNLTTINLGGVETIEEKAFYDCKALTGINLENVKTIGLEAFRNCTNLNNITIGSKVEEIMPNVFLNTSYFNDEANCVYGETGGWQSTLVYLRSSDGCHRYLIGAYDIMAEFVLPADVTLVQTGLLHGCYYGLKVDENNQRYTSKINGEETNCIIEKGENNSYKVITGTTKPMLKEGITEIGDYAFYGMSVEQVSAIVIPSSVERIGNYAFAESYLTSIDLGNVKEIGDYAFYKTTGLTGELILRDGLEKIGNSAFAFTNITSVNIPDSVTILGNETFYYCDDLKEAIIGDGVAIIESWVFSYCTSLETISFGNITSIGDSAFAGSTSITIITIPDTVVSIGRFAFADWTKAQTINFIGTMPEDINTVSCVAAATVLLNGEPYTFE